MWFLLFNSIQILKHSLSSLLFIYSLSSFTRETYLKSFRCHKTFFHPSQNCISNCFGVLMGCCALQQPFMLTINSPAPLSPKPFLPPVISLSLNGTSSTGTSNSGQRSPLSTTPQAECPALRFHRCWDLALSEDSSP